MKTPPDSVRGVYTWDLYDFRVIDRFWEARIDNGRPMQDGEDPEKARWVDELVRREKARREQGQGQDPEPK